MGNAIIVSGEPVHVGRPVRTWHETGLAFTALRPRPERTRAVCLHWTGGSGDARQVRRTLVGRGLSVHFVIEADGAIVQLCDADMRCSHATGANAWSVGIEIVNPANQLADTRGVKRPLLLERIHGREQLASGYTAPQVLSTLALVEALCGAYGLPMVVPLEGHDVLATVMPQREQNHWLGVLGHLHLSPGKRDPGLAILRAVAAKPARSAPPPQDVV